MKKTLLIILGVLLANAFVTAQYRFDSQMRVPSLSMYEDNLNATNEYGFIRKKTMKEHLHASVGFQVGMFSSAVPAFDSVFGTNNTQLWGLTADFNILSTLNIELKYHTFSKSVSRSDKSGLDPDITTTTIKAAWDQNMVTIGPKFFFKPNGSVYPYVSVGFGYFGASMDYENTVVVKGANPSTTISVPKHKTYDTFFGLAFEGGIRYILEDEGLALFVNGEVSLASVTKFNFDPASKAANANIGGIGFTTGFIYIL